MRFSLFILLVILCFCNSSDVFAGDKNYAHLETCFKAQKDQTVGALVEACAWRDVGQFERNSTGSHEIEGKQAKLWLSYIHSFDTDKMRYSLSGWAAMDLVKRMCLHEDDSAFCHVERYSNIAAILYFCNFVDDTDCAFSFIDTQKTDKE